MESTHSKVGVKFSLLKTCSVAKAFPSSFSLNLELSYCYDDNTFIAAFCVELQ